MAPGGTNGCVSEVIRQGKKGVCAQFVHGRRSMIMNFRIPSMPGRSTSGVTNQADMACTNREAP